MGLRAAHATARVLERRAGAPEMPPARKPRIPIAELAPRRRREGIRQLVISLTVVQPRPCVQRDGVMHRNGGAS
jgi:hypothetical protein